MLMLICLAPRSAKIESTGLAVSTTRVVFPGARRVVYRKNLLGVRRKMVGLGFPSRGRRICLSGPHSRHSGPSAPPYRFGPADRSVEILRFWHASRDPNSLTMGGAHQLQCRRPSSSVPESLDLNYAYAGVEAVEYENRS